MNTDNNNLTSDDICKIIKACADNGVYKISVSTLAIEFGEYKIKNPENITVPRMTQEAHDKQNAETLVSEELKTKSDQIDMLMIEDPVLAEEMIANGDLENDGSGDDDSNFDEDDLHS